MQTIWKYELELTDAQDVLMPLDAKILAAGIQDDSLMVWALVNTEAERTKRTFYVFGTGHEFPQRLAAIHVGTVQQGPLVWHVFVEPTLRESLGSALGF